MFIAYLLAPLTFLAFAPCSLAEHAGHLKHKHPLRHAVASLEPRSVPTAFDALQWDDDTRQRFYNANHHEIKVRDGDVEQRAAAAVVHVQYTTIWQIVYVTGEPPKPTTSSFFNDGLSTTLLTAISAPHALIAPDLEDSTTVSTSTSVITSTVSSVVGAKIHTKSRKSKTRSKMSSLTLSVASSIAPSVASSITSSVASSITSSQTHTRSASMLTAMLAPTATYSLIHGAARNAPPSQYIDCAAQKAKLPTLPVHILSSLNNPSFQATSPLFQGSGTLTLDSADADQLQELSTVPAMNRDGGHGGVIGGHKIFYFADTSTYTTPSANADGTWTGFVSNSIALDVGNNAFDGKPLTLQDPVGAFINNMGTQRNFVPFTEDEASWSLGNGWAKRYAIWPWGSLVALTNETSYLYAPIIIQDNNADPQFRSAGVTLVSISMTADGQPIVDRPVPGLFPASDPQFGVYGGIRSWGPSGVGGTDGKIYVLGTHNNGLLLGRTDASTAADYASYEYWDNSTSPARWSSTPSYNSFFMHGAYSSGDIFYSPMHGTFINVGQNPYTDSKFYYQYLMAPEFIRPSEAGEAYVDIVENICKYPWSETIFLFDTPVLATGKYTYDGGVHQGYFDDQDIVNGGNRMLLAWTAPTGKPAGSVAGGYQIWTAEVKWN